MNGKAGVVAVNHQLLHGKARSSRVDPQTAIPYVTLAGSQPILAVRDVMAAVRFYRDQLGFTEEWLWGDPPDFGGVRWGKVGVMFSLAPELAARIEGHEHAFFVNRIEELYQRHQRNGTPILTPLEPKPWGLKEYTVRDPNGYHLRFGEHAAAPSSHPAARALPPNVRLVERLPTIDEYITLVHGVGWTAFVNLAVAPEALRHSVYAIVAEEHGRAVGMARLAGDRASCFSLQDVMVLPAYQRRGIGSALLDAVMQHFQGTAPRLATIQLLTGRNLGKFYERWGFEGPETSLYGMSLKKWEEPSNRGAGGPNS